MNYLQPDRWMIAGKDGIVSDPISKFEIKSRDYRKKLCIHGLRKYTDEHARTNSIGVAANVSCRFAEHNAVSPMLLSGACREVENVK